MGEVYNILNWAKTLVLENPIPALFIVVFAIFLLVIMFDY